MAKPDSFRKPCKQFPLLPSHPHRCSFERRALLGEHGRDFRDLGDLDESEFAIVGSKVSRLCPRHNKRTR